MDMKTDQLKRIAGRIIKPVVLNKTLIDIGLSLPRILAGFSLSYEFGSPKFGMPWSVTDEMGLFQVANWFPEDVANFGVPFNSAPVLFAWLGAAAEAIGGLFLCLGLFTRVSAFFIACTMLVAIFFQKWPEAMEYESSWPLLPALGFLWIAIYSLLLGSGKYGLDYLIAKRLN